MLKLKLPIFWPPDVKNWLLRKDPDAGKDWRQEEKRPTEDEMVGRHHWLNGHEFAQARGVGDGQRGLACCSPWGQKESDTTEWTELNWWTLTFEYHIAFTYHKVLFFEYFQPFKNVKTILSSQAIQKQVAGWISPNKSHIVVCQALASGWGRHKYS